MNQKRVVTADEKFPINPEHIDASDHLYDSFENSETEISAGWVVRFMQARKKGWVPFTMEEIEAFYSKKHNDGFSFNRLVEPQMIPPSLSRAFAGCNDPLVPAGGGWIILGDDGKYYVTDDFIVRCFMSSRLEKGKKK